MTGYSKWRGLRFMMEGMSGRDAAVARAVRMKQRDALFAQEVPPTGCCPVVPPAGPLGLQHGCTAPERLRRDNLDTRHFEEPAGSSSPRRLSTRFSGRRAVAP